MQLRGLQGLTQVLTVVAAAAAAGVALVTAVAAGEFALAVAVLGALLIRLRAPSRSWRHVGAVGLVLAVAGVVGSTGGLHGLLLVALLFVIADYGLTHRPRDVVFVGLAAASTTATVSLVTDGAGAVTTDWLWFLVLVPLAGVTVGQVGGRQSMDGTAALESAMAAMDEVLALAERLPAGFDRWSVATAVHLELLEVSRRPDQDTARSHLLLVDDGVLFGVGAPIGRQPVGLLDDLPPQRARRTWTSARRSELPPSLASHLDSDRWHLHRLEAHGCNGVVLIPSDVHAAALPEIADVLRPAAVALANVERFERLKAVADSSARRRLAHDLHDGVAQALTHVRFELELLGLEHVELAGDVQRIRHVADAALLEVRRTVGELSESVPLDERIQHHVEMLSSFVPAAIDLELDHDLDVSNELADDIFRVVQESLSNAVRHARATTIRVAVTMHEGSVSVLLADDGVGIPEHPHAGIGLRGMQSRASRLGGDLTVRPRRGGGTVVEFDVPLPRLSSVVRRDAAEAAETTAGGQA